MSAGEKGRVPVSPTQTITCDFRTVDTRQTFGLMEVDSHCDTMIKTGTLNVEKGNENGYVQGRGLRDFETGNDYFHAVGGSRRGIRRGTAWTIHSDLGMKTPSAMRMPPVGSSGGETAVEVAKPAEIQPNREALPKSKRAWIKTPTTRIPGSLWGTFTTTTAIRPKPSPAYEKALN